MDAAPRTLRHGRPWVGVSTLASQWYCELKVDLAHRHPEIVPVLAALDHGTEGHRQLSADAVEITREELEREVAAGNEIFLQETRFEAEIEGVPVVGVPDLVHLRGRRCELVLEMKFSRRPDLFVDRYVQAQTYALLLAGNGYAMDGAACVVGVVSTPLEGDRARRIEALKEEGVLGAILDRCRDLRERPSNGWEFRGQANPVTIREGCVTLQAFPYHRAAALRHLRWAFDYWKGRREASAADRAAKCRSCPYNAARVCGQARSGPDSAFEVVRRVVEGREVLEVSRRA